MTLLFHRCPEELDKPGTTIGTKFSVLQIIRIPSLMRCGFWPLIHSQEYPFSSQSFPSDNTAGVFSRTFTVKNISKSLTYTIASSSCVCTSPLAVMTIVGLHDFVKVSISTDSSPLCWSCASTLRSPQQILFSSGVRFDAGRHLFSEGEKNAALWCSFNFNTLLASFHATSRAPCSLPFRLFLRPILKFLGHWGCADEDHLGKYNRAKDFGLEFWYDVQ